MSGLTTLYLSACLCVGAGAFSLVLASALKSGRRELGYFLLFFLTLMLLDASNFVLFNLHPTGASQPGGVSHAMYILMLVNRCLTVAICLGGSLMAQAILDVPWRRWGTAVVCVLSLSCTLVAILPPATRYDPVTARVFSPAAFDPAVFVSLANIVYMLVLMLFFRSRIPEKRTRSLVLVFLVVSAFFGPAIASDIAARSEGGVIAALPTRLAFFPLYIVALSIAVFVLALPYLARERHASPGAADGLPSDSSATRRREELVARHGLTSRESEIMVLVAGGMSNKEIAYELGISDRTVGNHIFNMYRKLGINSRFELMGLMR